MKSKFKISTKYFEIFLWILLAFMYLYRIGNELLLGNFSNIYYDLHVDLILGTILLLVPFLFYKIFGNFPLHYIKEKIDNKQQSIQIIGDSAKVVFNDRLKTSSAKEANSEEYLQLLAFESRLLSEKILSRSGAYLIIGCLIGLIGIIFFSFIQIEIPINDKDNYFYYILLTFLPKFGVLFFVEFVAFFFLKQYRITMDEFRYFESIQRYRESDLAIIKLIKEKGDFEKVNFKDFIEKFSFFITPGKLSKDETTDLLESIKQSNTETNLNIINKLIEFITKNKS